MEYRIQLVLQIFNVFSVVIIFQITSSVMKRERWLIAAVLLVLGLGCLITIINSSKFELVLTRENKIHEKKSTGPLQGQRSLKNSEVVHIVQICHNWESIRRLTTFLKSMLFHRSCPIVLHILTNTQTNTVITELFRTWNLPFLEIKVYVRDDAEVEIRWVWYLHRAGPYALKKLMLEKILPPDLDKIIFYDADVVMMADVFDLWKLFDEWNTTHVIGLSPETQSWYGNHTTQKKIWPSIDWGYNTGLILYDLKKLRNVDWPSLWKPVARTELAIRGYALLPEQDILNACFVDHPEILYKVPCVWNMQFGFRVNTESCPQVYGFKALHTTIQKMSRTPDSAIPSLPLYRNVIEHFSNMDGERFKSEPDEIHRIFPYFQNFDDPNSSFLDVTLILCLTFDNLALFEQVVANWPGPMSVAIFGNDKDAADAADWLPQRQDIVYHFVYRKNKHEEVPVRLLRTIAIKNVRTSHIILGDLKYRVSDETYENLKNIIKGGIRYIAVPSFESTCVLMADLYEKEELLKHQIRGKIKTIPSIEDRVYKKWTLSSEAFIANWRSKHFYYVARPTASHPVFQKKFVGRHYEDIQYEDDFLLNKEVLVAACCFALKLPLAIDVIRDPTYTIQC